MADYKREPEWRNLGKQKVSKESEKKWRKNKEFPDI